MTAPSSWLLCCFEMSPTYFEHLPVLWHKKNVPGSSCFSLQPPLEDLPHPALTSPSSWPETLLTCLDFDNTHRMPSHMNSLFISLTLNQKHVFIPHPTPTSFMKTSLPYLGLRSPFGGYSQLTHSSFKTSHSIFLLWICPTHSDQAPTLRSKATYLHGHCPPPHSVPGCHVTWSFPCSPAPLWRFLLYCPHLSGDTSLVKPSWWI